MHSVRTARVCVFVEWFLFDTNCNSSKSAFINLKFYNSMCLNARRREKKAAAIANIRQRKWQKSHSQSQNQYNQDVDGIYVLAVTFYQYTIFHESISHSYAEKNRKHQKISIANTEYIMTLCAMYAVRINILLLTVRIKKSDNGTLNWNQKKRTLLLTCSSQTK